MEHEDMKPKMIDIHSHILPYTDDGAENWENSLTMLKNAEAEGIRTIVATPHVLSEHHFKEEDEIIKKHLQLKKNVKAEGLKIEILLGCEIYSQPDTSLNHKIATLNSNGTYFLIEFPMNSIPQFVPGKLVRKSKRWLLKCLKITWYILLPQMVTNQTHGKLL